MATKRGTFILIALLFLWGCGGSGGTPSASTEQVLLTSEETKLSRYATYRDVALYVGEPDGLLEGESAVDTQLFFQTQTERGGSVRGYAAGSFFYTPPTDFVGLDSFSYRVNSPSGESEGTVEVTVRDGISGLSVDLYGSEFKPGVLSPTDPQEFASYLQAQLASGALDGATVIYQANAIPFTRFALVEEPELFDSAVARNYACQLAARSLGYDALKEEGLQKGAQEFEQMHPEAQLFLQVAAVFKGQLLEGPGEYDNPGLKQLLVSKGLSHYIDSPQVGDRDIPTLGAIGAAMNDGQLTMADILNSGTFEDVERYDLVVEYVYDGRFRKLVAEYEKIPHSGNP